MPPMTTGFARDGFVTDTMIDYYAARAKGGVGLVIVEDCIVDTPLGKHGYNDIFIDDDKFIPDLGRLTRAIKDNGARAAIQLNFSGRMAGKLREGRLRLTDGQLPVAPSAIAYPFTGFVVPRELTVSEIEAIEDRFAGAARRAQEAGFDMISLHCSHQFLIEQFLSPLSNQRRDAYGGSPERRQRFILEIIQKVRQKTGEGFPIICRVSGREYAEGGLTVDDARQIARSLEKAGVVGLNVSHGANPGGLLPRSVVPLTAAPKRNSRGELVPLAAGIKQAVSIPVMTVGSIITPQLAEEILAQGKADLVCIGKGLIADPEWPGKAREGREGEIRHCIACERCFASVGGTSLTCAINPAVGMERALRLTPAARPRKVFVAGGGPAGMEAARVAAARGHKVCLYEKDKLGGQLNMACRLPGKDEYELFLNYEREQLGKLGVRLENRELDRETIAREKPDAVIVATGAIPRKPKLPGSDNDNVVAAWQVLRGEMPRGKKIVVIGGGSTGAETAEILAFNGNTVTVVEKLGEVAADTANLPFYHLGLRRALEVLGVNLCTGTTAEEITGRGLVVSARGQRRVIEADMVVIALGAAPDRRLADRLKKMGLEVHKVGDCAGVANLSKAVKEGFHAGLAL
jgi:2,4-dienoyl-CoA reductase-like NADH-dependent reductase (Old Yellow Enzyme family)/thioredoxin reductase